MNKLICVLCAIDPLSHSFRKLNCQNKHMNLFYSCPAEATQNFELDSVRNHLDIELTNNNNVPWGWIIDCNGFTMKHATEIQSIIEISDLITNKYANQLKKIWIINTNWVIKCIINMLWPFLPMDITPFLI